MLSRFLTHRVPRPASRARAAPVRVAAALVMAMVAAVTAHPLSGTQTPAASDLAARVQARYNTIRDFTADFTQRQTSPLLPKPVVERGEVKIKKPGRMRWVYTTGDRNQVISDGTTIYAYFPQDRHVSPTPMPRGDEASTALLFLAGQGNIKRDFTATMPAEQPAGEWRLTLRPRTQEADFETLTLEIDRVSLTFRGLVVVDQQGGTSAFRFTNMRENRGLADSEFAFVVPGGVEVR
jgi:outer membrane lipoprotein carrier protein